MPACFKSSRSRQINAHLTLDTAGSLRHDKHTIGEEHGFLDVVRNENYGGAYTLPHAQKVEGHVGTGKFVKGGERFIHEQNGRFEDKGSGE